MRAYAALALALAGAASAAVSTNGLKILAPGGDNLWWLQGQDNNVVWTCSQSQIPQFTVWLNNTDTASTISAITALISVEPNYVCAQLLTANLLSRAPVGTGYTIVLTSITNATEIYAVSDPFEIKALSAGYPPATNTPVDAASATVSRGSASVVTGNPTSSGSPPTKSNAAVSSRNLGVAGVLGAAVLGAARLAL
ncbi:hypothetical protein MIND_01355100 [Mycena indigotica]|uniref:Uncharacterized protein n=1 Tax=Mycena indigotica TaxID=2126181 RepID=A0A8H6S003_9AGAR|nr:uncharacterized protein MIND_01355100 [Mycena indigotica]KAF7289808.1 hypothetical protein MIND_01355100 [Mycena indigotica]